jgi:NADH-quinone oxidoreductase subunit E
LLPVLHAVQHAHGWIPSAAMVEIATFLGMSPAEVMDTATFYEEYWLRPKGKYLIQVCRSLACEICASKQLTSQVQKKLGLEIGETTSDGKFTLVELECLGSCGTAPAALVNEVLHENLTPERLDAVLNALPDDPADQKDPTITWDAGDGHGH